MRTVQVVDDHELPGLHDFVVLTTREGRVHAFVRRSRARDLSTLADLRRAVLHVRTIEHRHRDEQPHAS